MRDRREFLRPFQDVSRTEPNAQNRTTGKHFVTIEKSKTFGQNLINYLDIYY